MAKSLERLFNPRSIALVGASENVRSIAGQPLSLLKQRNYPGRLYPVNPRHRELLGFTCYASVGELPETPDLALLMVNAARVPEVLAACGEKGVSFAIVFASGFAELGGDGRELQRRIIDIARRYDIGVIGPNCQGMLSTPNRVYAGFGSSFIFDYPVGEVSMVSQSGGFGFSVMTLASLDGKLPHRHVVTTGNETGVSTLEIMEYFIDDPGTRIITAYVEGLKDARRLVEVGSKALAAGKPIMIWKVGNSEQGRVAAASHTANLGGEMALYRAAFKQTGIIEVEDAQDIVDWSHAFLYRKPPAGNRVAIITVSGGAGILMTDECIAWGMQVPPLTAQSIAELRRIVPAFASLVNPIDVTAAILDDRELVERALRIVVADPNIDSVAIVNASIQGELAVQIARAIVEVDAQTEKPIFLAWSARDEVAGEAYAIVEAKRIPHYKSPVRCGRALAVLARYAGAYRHAQTAHVEAPLVLDQPEMRRLLAGRREDLAEHAAKQVLERYGVSVTRERLATHRDEAAAIAAQIGFPVALKLQSPGVSHKTEANGVRLNCADAGAVKSAYDDIVAAAARFKADARIDGVLVQEMIEGGVETILGIDNDPLFGPAIMFGIGGIFAEALKDVVFRLAPVNRTMALEMIREVKGYALLAGARGRPQADIDALADAIVRVSALAIDLKDELAELDVNPLFVLPQGRGVKAGDALIRPLAARPREE